MKITHSRALLFIIKVHDDDRIWSVIVKGVSKTGQNPYLLVRRSGFLVVVWSLRLLDLLARRQFVLELEYTTRLLNQHSCWEGNVHAI